MPQISAGDRRAVVGRFLVWTLLLQWAWEVAHGPAFVETSVPLLERIRHCAPMAATDTVWTAAVVTFAFAVARRSARRRTAVFLAVVAASGATTAIVFEMWAVAVRRWTYNQFMPVVPPFGVGLWPVLQMTIVPPLAVWLARVWSGRADSILQEPGRGRRVHLLRVLSLFAASAAISALHYGTDPSRVVWHEVLQQTYYVPIAFGAYWYGVPGGVLTALLVSVAYLPHVWTMWSGQPSEVVNRYAEIAMYYVIGLLVGALSAAQHRHAERHRAAAASLAQANRALRDSHEHLRQAERLAAAGEISAALAHEIKTPLASMRGALEIIADQARPGTPQVEFSTLATRELLRLEQLIADFLNYARPRAPELRDTDLGTVTDAALALLRPQAERRQVALEITRAGEPSRVRVDPQQIEQVLVNVVLNAIQAAPSGSTVWVREEQEPGSAIVDVIDGGPGIPAEHLARIFDPFFTTKPKGTGLGLAVSHRIVTAHRGTLEAISPPHGGTRVRLRLPLVPVPEQPPAMTATHV